MSATDRAYDQEYDHDRTFYPMTLEGTLTEER